MPGRRRARTGAGCFPDHDNDSRPGLTALIRDDEAVYDFSSPCTGGDGKFRYRGSPTSLLSVDAGGGLGGGTRITELNLGMRVNVGGAGQIECDCESGSGGGAAKFVDTRAAGCKSRPDGMPGVSATTECDTPTVAFIDSNLPNFRILHAGEKPPATVVYPASQGGASLADGPASSGPRSALVRIADLGTPDDFGGVTCDAVRAVSFPNP